MIFIDSNVPMYLIGAPHPRKTEAQILVERLVAERRRLVTDVEVLQEILHRYAAIDRRDAIPEAIQLILELSDELFPVEEADVLRAAEIVQNPTRLTARDALHIAVMERRGIKTILSFDSDFDRWPGLERIHEI